MKGAEPTLQAFTTRDPKTGEQVIDPAKVTAFVRAELATTAVTGRHDRPARAPTVPPQRWRLRRKS